MMSRFVAMTIEDQALRERMVHRLFGSLDPASGQTTEWWRRVDRYRLANHRDCKNAYFNLKALWSRGDTMHRNIVRNQFTPLEWTLTAIWPRHDRQADATTWRIICAQIGGMRALAMNGGIAGADPAGILVEDLSFLCLLAIGRENQTTEATA